MSKNDHDHWYLGYPDRNRLEHLPGKNWMEAYRIAQSEADRLGVVVLVMGARFVVPPQIIEEPNPL